ncbi:hypothetical protein AB4Y30_16525 [Ornithinibacillus sp. 4-3]|uniref:DUF4362 domain-containing protein n=1 Tax=Ornithinibacillus sp. 4-3 TaxID=3231488 RepID=A0AB39HQ08_9BACI
MKRTFILLVLLLPVFLLIACGKEPVEENQSTEEEVNDEEEMERITNSGIYNGQQDPHTIEIETEDGTVAYQIVMNLRETVEKLEVGEEVSYTYYQDGAQLIIEEITGKGITETEEPEEETTDNESNEKEDEKMTASGIYNGRADSHTVEIETETGPVAYQLTMEARDQADQLEEGQEVTYTYKQEGEQLIIESIKHTEEQEGELITETGIYNGQQDPHTIEIETAEGPTAFQLTMEARDNVEQLVVGEEVIYEYKDNGTQLVIEKISMK